MYPNIFIEKKFWQILDQEALKIKQSSPFEFDKENKNRKNSFERILSLIRSSNIYTNENLLEIDLKQITSKEDNAKSLIIKEIIKSDVYENSRKLTLEKNITDFKKEPDFCFFCADEISSCEKEANENGHIHVGRGFLENDFFPYNSFPVEHTQKDLSRLNKIFHPCNSLVIIDPYLFTSFEKKKNYLFNFLRRIIPKSLNRPFELDIVIKNQDKYHEVNIAKNKILSEFDNLSLHIYHTKELNDSESDRYLITNYALISVGHPFDRDSNISSNFFPSNNDENLVIQSYKTRIKKLEFIKKIITKTPKEISPGFPCIIMNDTLNHRIFNLNTFSDFQ
jgi:hypothetical protein